MHYVHQDGQAVFKFAVRKQADLCERILERNGLKGSDIDCFIPHQANKRIIMATADRLGMRPESLVINIDHYGNTTAGTIPLAMETSAPGRKIEERQPGATGVSGRGIYAGRDAATVGLLESGHGFSRSTADRAFVMDEFLRAGFGAFSTARTSFSIWGLN